MGLIQTNWNPTSKQLRDFAKITPLATALLALLLYLFKNLPLSYALGLFLAGVAVFLVDKLSQKPTKALYLCLMAISFPIGTVVAFVLLAVVYYLIFTPVGLLLRLLGRDPLNRKFDPDASTYWIPHKQTTNPERYFHQY